MVYDTQASIDLRYVTQLRSLTYMPSPVPGGGSQLKELLTGSANIIFRNVVITNAPKLEWVLGMNGWTTLIINGNLTLTNLPSLCLSRWQSYVTSGRLNVMGTMTVSGLNNGC